MVAKEKFKIVNDDLFNFFFGLELNLRIERTCRSENHMGNVYFLSQIPVRG